MTIAHFSVSIVSYGSGRGAVLSAAYPHSAKMECGREALAINRMRKHGMLHEEFVMPANASEWVRTLIPDRSVSGRIEALKKTEAFGKRGNAQLTHDLTIALSLNLSPREYSVKLK